MSESKVIFDKLEPGTFRVTIYQHAEAQQFQCVKSKAHWGKGGFLKGRTSRSYHATEQAALKAAGAFIRKMQPATTNP